jgi:hypothetical protein
MPTTGPLPSSRAPAGAACKTTWRQPWRQSLSARTGPTTAASEFLSVVLIRIICLTVRNEHQRVA